MGDQEVESKKRQKRVNVRKMILHSIAGVGLLSVALVAPNVIGAMGKLGLIPNNRQEEIIKRSRKRLVKQGLLIYKDGNLSLTPKGEKELRLMDEEMYKVKKPRRWDGKWRVLTFDISEKRRHLRNRIRTVLYSVGFVRLQDSVWLYPYDSEDMIILLKADLKIGKEVLYLIVDSLENDGVYRRHFKLKS